MINTTSICGWRRLWCGGWSWSTEVCNSLCAASRSNSTLFKHWNWSQTFTRLIHKQEHQTHTNTHRIDCSLSLSLILLHTHTHTLSLNQNRTEFGQKTTSLMGEQQHWRIVRGRLGTDTSDKVYSTHVVGMDFDSALSNSIYYSIYDSNEEKCFHGKRTKRVRWISQLLWCCWAVHSVDGELWWIRRNVCCLS